jgi:hypothetical protein
MFNLFKPKTKSKMAPNKKKEQRLKVIFTTYDREKTSMMHLLTHFNEKDYKSEFLPTFFKNSNLFLNYNGYKFNMSIQEYIHNENCWTS